MLFVAKFRDRCRVASAAPPLATAVARYFAPEVFGGLRAAERPPHDKSKTYESLLRKLVQ